VLEAVKDHRVWALPWTPYNCAKRLEYPIEVMVTAKAAYPQLFNDIKIHEWVLDFYKTVYHVDNGTAISLRSIQWLDWTVEEDV
jgi:iron complex transport system substrate-binding protein